MSISNASLLREFFKEANVTAREYSGNFAFEFTDLPSFAHDISRVLGEAIAFDDDEAAGDFEGCEVVQKALASVKIERFVSKYIAHFPGIPAESDEDEDEDEDEAEEEEDDEEDEDDDDAS